MKRALFLRVLLCIAVPSVIAQEPDKAAATHYKVAGQGNTRKARLPWSKGRNSVAKTCVTPRQVVPF